MMKYLLVNILIVTLVSCHERQNASVVRDKEIVKHDSSRVSVRVFNGLWQQFKKEGAMPDDTIPNRKCYIRINADTFNYIIDGKYEYKDILLKDSNFEYPVYGFKEHYHDKLLILTNDFKDILLKKNANEGDYEYFKRISN